MTTDQLAKKIDDLETRPGWRAGGCFMVPVSMLVVLAAAPFFAIAAVCAVLARPR
jgi:hypothetical protein